jgi:diguanylate cyclase (GGDEF)-like protein/PAS domain S-box-containing protein
MPTNRFRQQVILWFVAALGLLWSALMWDSQRAEDQALNHARRETAAWAATFASQAQSTFVYVDHALMVLRQTWLERPSEMGDAIRLHLDAAEGAMLQIAVINAKGYLVYSNLGVPQEPTFLGDREHFTVHQAQLQDRMFISRPVKGRVSGKWSIQLTRPMFQKGHLVGVIVASVNPDHFVKFYKSTGFGNDGAARMIRDSGEVMARSSEQEKYLGTVINTSPYTDPGAPLQGSFRRKAQVDGVERLSSYYRLPQYGLTLVVGPSIDDTLAPVRSQQARAVIAGLLVSVLLALISWQLVRNSARQASALADQAQSRLQLQASHDKLQQAASVFTHAREGIMITDANGTIVDVNDTFTRITGFSRDEALGQNPRILNSGRQPPEYYAAMWRALLETGQWSGEVWNRRKDGEVYAEMQTVSAVRDGAGRTQSYVALFSDITPMKMHQAQLERIAHFDALTHLPNRVLLADRLQLAIAQSQRRGRSLAVVYLDLDGFKAVNDRHGHAVGDTLLVTVSQRMKAALREGDTLARIGGDEFVAILVDMENPQDCDPVLERLLQAASAPIETDVAVLRVSASMGVTIYPQDGSVADLLVRHADQAMYAAKQAGKNRYHRFDIAQTAPTPSP